MKAKFFWIVLAGCLMSAGTVNAQRDTTRTDRNYPLNEVVVTGVRHETDIRHLSQTVSVVGRPTIEQSSLRFCRYCRNRCRDFLSPSAA